MPNHRLLITLPLALLLAGPLAAQPTTVGLSTVRAQRFGNQTVGNFTPLASDLFGYTLVTGDFNGDGADDLATGMPYDNGPVTAPVTNSGSIVVRYGKKGGGLDAVTAPTYLRQGAHPDPAEANDLFGRAMAACDFNGDGLDDLAVGIPDEDYSGTDSGVVQVHFGTPAGLPALGNRMIAQSTNGVPGDVEEYDQFGWSVACGNFNDDAFDDLAIGSPGENWRSYWDDPTCAPPGIPCALSMGMVVIIPGAATGFAFSASSHLDQDVDGMGGGAENGDYFGYSLAAGNFDGDDYDDLAIGVPGEDDDEGQLQVVFGGPSGPIPAGSIFWSESFIGGVSEDGDRFSEVLAAGDFDGDGLDDLAISGPFEDVGSAVNAGQVTILYGALDGFDRSRAQFFTEDAVWAGSGLSEANDAFGYSLAAGDFDHDGYEDLAIGHPAESIGGGQDGAATVILGTAARLNFSRRREIIAGSEGFPGDPAQHGEYFGWALSSGDFDGDGHADLVLGAPQENEAGVTDVGAETVLYGALFADGVETGNTNLWSQTKSTLYFNKVEVSTAAKLGPLTSKNGIRVSLVNPSFQFPASSVYVRVGPEAGFHDERTLKGSFFVDPQSLTMSPGAGIFQMMAFADVQANTGGKARLAFDLTRDASNWFLVANYFNEITGFLQFAGSGVIAAAGDANGRNTRIDFEWTAGAPGHLSMWRTRFVNGAPDANGRQLLFSVDLAGTQNTVINHAFAGMIVGQDPGTYGPLYFDELSFRR